MHHVYQPRKPKNSKDESSPDAPRKMEAQLHFELQECRSVSLVKPSVVPRKQVRTLRLCPLRLSTQTGAQQKSAAAATTAAVLTPNTTVYLTLRANMCIRACPAVCFSHFALSFGYDRCQRCDYSNDWECCWLCCAERGASLLPLAPKALFICLLLLLYALRLDRKRSLSRHDRMPAYCHILQPRIIPYNPVESRKAVFKLRNPAGQVILTTFLKLCTWHHGRKQVKAALLIELDADKQEQSPSRALSPE